MNYGLVLLLLFVNVVSVSAQEAEPDPYPTILLCEQGSGCKHSPISGDLTYLDASLALGEPEMDGARVIICDSIGCSWGVVSDADADLVYGGDGTPDASKVMRFEEDEVEPEGFEFTEEEAEAEGFDFSEEEVEADGFDFSEDELGLNNVVPLSGAWTAVHDAGTLNCSGAFSMEIPAGDEQEATITVTEDGNSFTALDLDPETPQMTMERVGSGHYHTELPIETPDGTMTLVYDVGFFDPALAVGMIRAEISSQGVACSVERGVTMFHESLDLFPGADEAAEEANA